MGTVARARIAISGDVGGNGVMTLYMHLNDFSAPTASNVTTWLGYVHTMVGSWTTWLSNKQTFTYPSTVQLLDSASGVITAISSGFTVPSAQTGAGTGPYGAGVGFRLQWNTSNIINHRVVKGYTFVTGAVQASFTTSGTIDSTAAAAISGPAGTYLTSMASSSLVPCVFHRPKKGTFTGGQLCDINSASVHSQLASLRSRRS